MALPIIGGASIDEKGNARGGKAGDQKNEVKRQSYYNHKLGWVVLRPKESVDAEIIASTMEDIVDNNHIGYDQGQRHTMYVAGAPLGFKADLIKIDVETDCSAAVQFCMAAAGIMVGNAKDIFRTGTMIPRIEKTGRFLKLTTTAHTRTPANLKRGDILVTKTSGHTVVVLSDGDNIRRRYGERPISRGASGADVTMLQTQLKALGYGSLLGRWGENKDGIDGDYGQATANAVKAFEKDHKLPIDGTADVSCIKAIQAAVAAGQEPVKPEEPEDPIDDNAPDDTPDPAIDPEKPAEVPSYKCPWVVANTTVNVRTGPGTGNKKIIALYPGTGLMYDGETKDGWHAVLHRGKRHWVSAKLTKFEVREKFILDLSVYDDVESFETLAKYVSYIWIRVACRRETSNGEVYIDAKFKKHAAGCKKYGIPFGVYVYGRAKTAPAGQEEARKAVEWAEPYGPTSYVYDIEAPTLTHISCAAFLAEVKRLTGKPVGIYVGRHWSQVDAGDLKRDFTWCPYYSEHLGGAHGGRNPSHPHDAHQYSCALKTPGKNDPGDVSHINTDPKTNGTGHTIEYFRGIADK